MSEKALKEINNLLSGIFVFEADFKEEILAKAKQMDDTELKNLNTILSEVDQWQDKTLTKKFKEDPNFYNKIAGIRKKANQEVVNLYKQKLGNEDREKMGIILNKINSIN